MQRYVISVSQVHPVPPICPPHRPHAPRGLSDPEDDSKWDDGSKWKPWSGAYQIRKPNLME
jgi:hypothetical protein